MMQRSLNASSHYCVTMGRFGGAEGQMVRTFGRGRICAGGCGTVLSMYNRGRLCAACGRSDKHVDVTPRQKCNHATVQGSRRKVDSAQALDRLEELVAHYGSLGLCARKIGVSDSALFELRKRRNPFVFERTHLAIVTHQPDLDECDESQKVEIPAEMSERLLELLDGGLSFPRMGSMCGLSKTTLRVIARREQPSATVASLAKIRKLFAVIDADTSTDALIFGERTCRTCGETKPLNRDYYPPDMQCTGGFKHDCRECRNTASRKRRRENEVTA